MGKRKGLGDECSLPSVHNLISSLYVADLHGMFGNGTECIVI